VGELSFAVSLPFPRVLLAIAAALFVLAAISDAQAQAKCLVPPITDQGKCLQKAGAQCDPSKGWVGGDATARNACLKLSGTSSARRRSRKRRIACVAQHVQHSVETILLPATLKDGATLGCWRIHLAGHGTRDATGRREDADCKRRGERCVNRSCDVRGKSSVSASFEGRRHIYFDAEPAAWRLHVDHHRLSRSRLL
jgi:hypothetical protein